MEIFLMVIIGLLMAYIGIENDPKMKKGRKK